SICIWAPQEATSFGHKKLGNLPKKTTITTIFDLSRHKELIETKISAIIELI
ncbi:18865_t:CDS:1, partial [Racocetra persica]